MSTLPPDVQERLLAIRTLPGKFIPPAKLSREGWNSSSLHNAANGDRVPQGVSAYHRAPNIIPSPSTTTIPFEAFPRAVIPTSAVPFAEAIEPSVNVFSDWSRPRALCIVEKGAPPAQAGRILVPVQAPSTGRSGGTSVAEIRAASRRPPAASRAGDAVRSCPTALRSPECSDWARARPPSVVPQRSKTYTG
jgi:hypothetical protein